MYKCLTLILGLSAIPSTAFADNHAKLVGSWKLVSLVTEFQDGGEKRPSFGQSPRGYQAFTADGRVIVLVFSDGRKPPTTDADALNAYRTMAAWSARYRVEGDKIITKIDASWNEALTGTERTATYKLDGGRLDVLGPWTPAAALGGKVVRNVSVWEREK